VQAREECIGRQDGIRRASWRRSRRVAGATGGEARRIADTSGNLNIPRILGVRSTDTYKGDDWLGLKMRDASVVRGIGVLPLFAGMLGLLLLIGSLAATWMREGR
jgi:hypothetical protein